MSGDQGQENLHLEPNTHTLPWLAQTQHVGDPRVLPLEMVPLSMSRRPSLGDILPQQNMPLWAPQSWPSGGTQPQEARASLLRDGQTESQKGRLVPGPSTRAEHLLGMFAHQGFTWLP